MTRAGVAPDGSTTVTRVEAGWNGIGHGQDLADNFAMSFGVTCPNPQPPCGNCTIDGIVNADSQYTAFTRCQEDPSIECAAPFTTDPACPGAQKCLFFTGPPLPLSASNTPICVMNKLATDLTGTVDVEAVQGTVTIAQLSQVHLGESQVRPCQLCSGDVTPNDGIKDGSCVGGSNHGGACDVHAFESTFARPPDGLSMDCPANIAKNFTGQGLILKLTLTTGSQSMPFGTNCDFPLGYLNCACAVCSGDSGPACNANADCSSAGAGTCTSNGGGASRQPNACSDQNCTDNLDGTGSCLAGPDVKYCDLQLRANGKGFLTCGSNADCATLDTFCDPHCDNDGADCGSNADCSAGGICSGNCGNCTLSETRSCFLEPIQSSGIADADKPVVATTFCVPPTNSSGINQATGMPGPSRTIIQLETRRNY